MGKMVVEKYSQEIIMTQTNRTTTLGSGKKQYKARPFAHFTTRLSDDDKTLEKQVQDLYRSCPKVTDQNHAAKKKKINTHSPTHLLTH